VNIYKIFLNAFYIWILFATIIFAQNRNEAAARIKVGIVQGIKIEPVKGNLDFGEIILDKSNSLVKKEPSEGIEFKVTGEPNKTVVVTYNETGMLRKDKSGETLPFNSSVVHTSNSESYANPVAVTNGTSYKLLKNKKSGLLYLWVGGKLNIYPTQSPGNYKGLFNITVAY